MRIEVIQPFDGSLILQWLAARAIAGVEIVAETSYQRDRTTVRLESGVLFTNNNAVRVRRLFDTAADPRAIGHVLGRDPLLRRQLVRHPGIRVPGAWDPFELCVRAIVGQQISVARARALLGAMVQAYGSLTPEALSDLRYGGMPGRRTDTIRELARAVASGTLDVERDDLTQLPGIGPWTANYVRMRLGDRDAFPAGDLILRRNAGNLTERELVRRAESWRPYRAYAAMLLWCS